MYYFLVLLIIKLLDSKASLQISNLVLTPHLVSSLVNIDLIQVKWTKRGRERLKTTLVKVVKQDISIKKVT